MGAKLWVGRLNQKAHAVWHLLPQCTLLTYFLVLALSLALLTLYSPTLILYLTLPADCRL